jgi:hypothetical protein
MTDWSSGSPSTVTATKGNWSKVMALSPDERTLYVAN